MPSLAKGGPEVLLRTPYEIASGHHSVQSAWEELLKATSSLSEREGNYLYACMYVCNGHPGGSVGDLETF